MFTFFAKELVSEVFRTTTRTGRTNQVIIGHWPLAQTKISLIVYTALPNISFLREAVLASSRFKKCLNYLTL